MAFIIQRGKSKIWYAVWKGRDGKQIRRSTGLEDKSGAEDRAQEMAVDERREDDETTATQREYAQILKKAVRSAEDGDLDLARAEILLMRLRSAANPDFRSLSVSESFREWVSDQASTVTKSTLSIYEHAHRQITAGLGKNASKPLTELTTDDVKKALSNIVKKKGEGRNVKASTANMALRAFRRAVEAAKLQNLVSENVVKIVKPLPEDDSTERAPFTIEEVRKLIETAKDRETKGMILIAAHTGLRMGDVIKLGRINVDGKKIVIRPDKTKRQKKTVTVPMTAEVIAWIGDLKGAFFPTLSTKTKATRSTNFARLMTAASVPKEITLVGDVKASRSFHSLRHSFTSWLAEAEVPTDVRQKLTGHSSAGVHANYTHADESLNRAVDKLPTLKA